MEKELVKKLLVITGANKGIGYSIIDGLMRQKSLDYNILMGARTIENGIKALEDLKKKYNELADCVKVIQLDITNEKSIDSFIELIKKDHSGKIDCLVNNAGVTVPTDEFNTRVFDYTFGTNYYATVNFTEKILSNGLMEKNSKIVIIGSSAGRLRYLKSEKLRERFEDKELTVEKITQLANEYRKAIEENTWEKDGWCESTYSCSKICINKYALVLGNRKEILEDGIQVYSCCPGWVKTDMGGKSAHRTLEEGSVTPVYLVNLKYEINKDYQGQFFYDEKVSNIY